MKVSSIDADKFTLTNLNKEVIKEFTLNCFLHHKIKLIRNWGSPDDTDQLAYKDVTLLQFSNRSSTLQIVMKPKDKSITIMHLSKRSRKLYLYFIKVLNSIKEGTYTPNFE